MVITFKKILAIAAILAAFLVLSLLYYQHPFSLLSAVFLFIINNREKKKKVQRTADQVENTDTLS